MSSRSRHLHIALILVLGLLVYSNTFEVPFVFDDGINVIMNTNIRSLSNIPAMLAGKGAVFTSRPLMHTTFALNYYFGGLSPWGYHAVNLALHLINGILLYFLVVMTGRLLRYTDEGARPVALFASVLFMVHPVQTEAVTYAVSRSMLLVTTFYLSGIMLFAKAATAERRKGLYIAGLFIVSLLGAASRENFVTFPVMLVLYDLFFISGFKTREALGRWRLYIPVLLACAYLVYLVLNNTYDPRDEFSAVAIPPFQYILTQLNVHWTYLRLLVLPIGQNLDYDYPTAQTLLEFLPMLSFLGCVGLLAGAMLFARRRSVVSFSIFWFFVALAPISIGVTVMGLRLGDVIFEHRFYLPSAGIIVGFSAVAVSAAGKMKSAWTRKAVSLCLVLALAVLSVAAYKRNEVWQSEKSLWGDVVKKSPNKMRGYVNLANAYNIEGQIDEAIRYNLLALTKDFPVVPVSAITMANYNLAYSYFMKGLPDKAIEHFTNVIELDPPWVGYAHGRLANVYMREGLFDKAIEHFSIAIKLEPRYVAAYNDLGVAYLQKGLPDRAIEYYKMALKINPKDAKAYVGLGYLYMQKGLIDEAIEHYLHSLRLNPNDLFAHKSLGAAYQKKGMHDEAHRHFRIADSLRQGGRP